MIKTFENFHSDRKNNPKIEELAKEVFIEIFDNGIDEEFPSNIECEDVFWKNMDPPNITTVYIRGSSNMIDDITYLTELDKIYYKYRFYLNKGKDLEGVDIEVNTNEVLKIDQIKQFISLSEMNLIGSFLYFGGYEFEIRLDLS
jgi:hypothetical protein